MKDYIYFYKDFSIPQETELTKEDKEFLSAIEHELWSFIAFALVLMISMFAFMIW